MVHCLLNNAIGIDFDDFLPPPLSHPPEVKLYKPNVTTRSRSNFILNQNYNKLPDYIITAQTLKNGLDIFYLNDFCIYLLTVDDKVLQAMLSSLYQVIIYNTGNVVTVL